MKRRTVMALMLGVTLAATGCGQKNETKETTAPETTEAATTEAETQKETTAETETTEAVSETETETETETVAETETETATETETEKAAAASETETETVAETETETETVAETETETETETAAETETETVAETETETAAETETETASETETAEETETVAETETETETVAEEETTEAESEEAESETGTESETETETEKEITLKDMPSYTASEFVTLGEYKGLEVTQEPAVEVTDEDVQMEIEYRISAAGIVDTLEEGTVEEGDTANIDYEGTKDGVAFEGGTAEGYDLEIGSGSFIEGFEEGLVGVAVGEETDLNLTFPEDYPSEELAGQEVVFHVKVNSISRQPEFSDEVAAQLEEGKTAEEYTKDVRAELEENALAMQQNAVKSTLLQTAVENAEISGYPTEKIAWYVDYQKSYYEAMVQMYGMELGDFLTASGYEDEEAFVTEIEEAYKPALEQEMVLLAVADAEAMEVTDEEFQAGLERYAAEIADMNGVEVTTEELLEQYGEAYVRESLLLDKAMEFLYENAEITEAASEETSETETEAVSEEVSEEETTEASETETEAVSEKTTEAASETETEETTESETETETVSETAETETEA